MGVADADVAQVLGHQCRSRCEASAPVSVSLRVHLERPHEAEEELAWMVMVLARTSAHACSSQGCKVAVQAVAARTSEADHLAVAGSPKDR